MTTRIVGILNCTPDSFSDRAGSIPHAQLITQADHMLNEGADIIDVGGDSTRPGSVCPGVEEEWQRISPVLSHFSHKVPISVDTHHPEIARRAIDSGAAYINDVSGQRTPEMLDIVARSSVSYIFMCNPHGGAHHFGDGFTFESALSGISSWIKETLQVCVNAGIPADRLIVDPGMGAFVSSDPRVSWLIAESLGELPSTQGGLLLGCSRKGFLKFLGEMDLDTKDVLSARIGAVAVRAVSSEVPTYLRVHNVARQREALLEVDSRMPEWRSAQS